ncbi:MAG TPA: hypothetical protein VF889_09775 [Bacteroidota bacterium]
MMRARAIPWLLVGALTLPLSACGPGGGTRAPETPAAAVTKEQLYQQGHRLYQTGALDSARAVLERAAALDSSYAEPVADLAQLHYDLAMAEGDEHASSRKAEYRRSLQYFARLEKLGNTDAATYERLCELAVALGDDRSFLRYAKRNAERYPFDRQYYNLGLAYFNAGDFQSVVRTQKEAAERFGSSPYLGGFYRQMGRAYMKLNRDQTAERMLESGLKAVDTRMTGARKEKGSSSDDYRRLTEDRIAILQLLRHLHQTYRDEAKLQEVEKLLKDAGALR